MDSTVLSVSWKDHSGALTEVCKTLLDNNFLVDCTIAAEGKALKAHRLILSACSPYFQMLFGEDCEKHPIVILQNASFDTLKAMIDFMYHGETQVPEEHLEAFLTLAETLQIKGLNDSSKKNRRKSQPEDSTRETRHRHSREEQKDPCEVQISSASHEPSPEHSSEQHHSYHSEVYPDVADNCSVSLEGDNSSYEPVKPSVIQSSQLPPLSDQVSTDAEQNVKSESTHHVYLVPKHEQMDEDESDEPPQDVSECDINEEATSGFGEQQMNQYPSVPSCSDSGNVLPGAFAMPQMAGPPDVQGKSLSNPTDATSSIANVSAATAACAAVLLQVSTGPTLLVTSAPATSPLQQQQQQQKQQLQKQQLLQQQQKQQLQKQQLQQQQQLLQQQQKQQLQKQQLQQQQQQNQQHQDQQQAQPSGSSSTVGRTYLCEECGVSFATPGRLAGHKRNRHKGDRPHKCDTCGAAFSLRCNLSVHRRSHGARPYACDVCGDTFTQMVNLAFHKRSHAGKPCHRCAVCGRSFKLAQGLKSHMRTHTGERPYKCDVCDLTFPYANSLRFHRRRHTGERPYLCATCGLSFIQMTALKRHQLTHAGVKQYSCDVCGKQFRSNFTLTTHKRRHTGERPYVCEMCGDTFRQSGNLTAHIFTKHTSLGME